ncbi:Glycoside hydrolase protein [Lasiodiplodia theobromae]|uniref:Glycoside hydrolase protein n=1 Tax=Lasiodiplodia theobromae TaxID=45133 RepID=UPI0015C3BCF6|nr:Glycoside hydrolase protein [Lasiodiplodia theobromae]KAF4543375.1 Glycoside hydrolase protein [Lasiodiplodia theobromae]
MRPINQIVLLGSTATAAAAQNSSSAINWRVNPSASSDAVPVNKDYIGFGIEMKSFPDYAGYNNATNPFSTYLLTQFSSRSGGAPIPIRVGGTSMDNVYYNESLTTQAVKATGDTSCDLHTPLDLGTRWLHGFANLAPQLDVRYTVQIPLARKNVTNGVALANACVDAMPGGDARRLDAFEIGNEPNYYPTIGCGGETDRNASWGPSDYAAEWTAYAEDLVAGVGALAESGAKDWFQTYTLASKADVSVWNLSNIWDELDQGGYVKTISQHYYQADATQDLKGQLLTHSTTVDTMQDKFGANIALAKTAGVDFVLGEVGAAIATGSGTPNWRLYSTLGGALWTLDFLLHGMAMGIARVSMQLGTNFRMSAWQPVTTALYDKAVHGNYYGLVAAAEFVNGDGDLQITEWSLDDVVGYAGYNGGSLSKIVVLDLNFWENSTSVSRPQRPLNLTNLGDDVTGVKVSYLTAPSGATDNSTITWAGKRWTAENDGTEYTDGPQPVTINVQGGVPVQNITIQASEALLLDILRD